MNWSSDNGGRNNAGKVSCKNECGKSMRGPWKTLQTRQGSPAVHDFESLELSGSSFYKQGKYKTVPNLKVHKIRSYV